MVFERDNEQYIKPLLYYYGPLVLKYINEISKLFYNFTCDEVCQ